MLAKDIFGQKEMQSIIRHEERAITRRQRPAAWQSIFGTLLRVRDNNELHKLVRELNDSIGDTLAALSTNLTDLRDCLKARQPPVQVLTQTIALADRALQQTHVTYLFCSPLWDEDGFSDATNRYAEGLVKLGNNEIQPTPRSPIEQTSLVETAAFKLFRDSLTFLDGRTERYVESIPRSFEPNIVAVKIHNYRNGVPSEVMEQFESNHGASELGQLGLEVDDAPGQFEAVCGNTVLVLTRLHGAYDRAFI
jgi:hypothetical protein